MKQEHLDHFHSFAALTATATPPSCNESRIQTMNSYEIVYTFNAQKLVFVF